jgi:hypothetical protein
MPTEAQIQLYEQRVALRGQRRQARRPAMIAFRNLFVLMILGGIIYVIAVFFSQNQDLANPPMPWLAFPALYAIGAYLAFVALILVVKHSDGHKVRTISRARRSALYEGHPWVQYRIEHPYMSHVLVVWAMLTVLNQLSGKRR